MKNIGVVTALLLAATLSSGAMAAENSFARPEAGSNIDTSVQATESWVKTPMRQTPFPGIVPDESDRAAETQSTLTSSGAMAAYAG